MEPSADVDAMVADAVRTIGDRFGADGLRDLVALASEQIRSSELAVADLGEVAGPTAQLDQGLGTADTQAWIAYTVQEAEADGDE